MQNENIILSDVADLGSLCIVMPPDQAIIIFLGTKEAEFFSHIGDMLQYLQKSGVKLLDYPELEKLADKIDYEFWLLGKFLKK